MASLKLRNIGPALMSGRVVGFAVNPTDRSQYFAAVASGGASHSIVQRLTPAVGVREPARLCCTKVSDLSTAPGMSCTRPSIGRQVPACFPFCLPEAKRAAISKPPRSSPSRAIEIVTRYAVPGV